MREKRLGGFMVINPKETIMSTKLNNNQQSIEIGENQLTTSSLSRYKKEITGLDGNTFSFPGFQVAPNILKSYPYGIYGDKPIFSFVIQLWSYDDGNSLDLEKIEISCIPHILSYEMTFNESILASTKGYKYLLDTYKNHDIYGYYERESFPSDFKIVQYHDAKQLNSLPPSRPKNAELKNIALLDPNNSNPRDPHSSLLRKFVGGYWKVVTGPDSFRISKEIIQKSQIVNGKEYENKWRFNYLDL